MVEYTEGWGVDWHCGAGLRSGLGRPCAFQRLFTLRVSLIAGSNPTPATPLKLFSTFPETGLPAGPTHLSNPL